MAEGTQSIQITSHPLVRTAALVLGLLGCAGEEVSAGRVGDTVNAARCYGTVCTASAAVALAEPEHVRCDAPLARRLVEDMRVEVTTGTVADFAVAPDGSIWVLHVELLGMKSWLEHYGPEGSLLAASAFIGLGGPHASARQHLSVDSLGRAWLTTYVQVSGGDADDAFIESVTLRGFDAEGQQLAPTQQFDALAESFAHVGADGAVTVAGNHARYQPRGSLLRLDGNGELLWNQTGVVTLGEGGGITGIVVGDDGASTVLAARARQGSMPGVDPGASFYSLTRFDPAGRAAGAGLIASALGGLSMPRIERSSGDTVVVSGMRGGDHLVQSFPADGSPGFAYLVSGALPSLAVDRATGDVHSQTLGGVATISGGGATCGVASLVGKFDAAWFALGGIEFLAGKLYYADSWVFGRLRWE
jgi:hypothetical protein